MTEPMDKAENPFANMTWICEICKESRPDDAIDVLKADLGRKHKLPPGTAFHNIKYCNDTTDCFAGAVRIRQLEQMEIEIDPANFPCLRPCGGQRKGSPRLAYVSELYGDRGRINVTNLDEVRTTVHTVY